MAVNKRWCFGTLIVKQTNMPNTKGSSSLKNGIDFKFNKQAIKFLNP